jgi:hypothetical protein
LTLHIHNRKPFNIQFDRVTMDMSRAPIRWRPAVQQTAIEPLRKYPSNERL